MTSSLVGSEMCIRHRQKTEPSRCGEVRGPSDNVVEVSDQCLPVLRPVSYTHLTLPTICSV
eukprot:4212214-Prorocentrum_lima.AAC.1